MPEHERRPRRPAAPIPAVLPLLLTREVCAALLSVSPRTFDRMRSEGTFPPPDVSRPGFVRWRRDTVEAWIEQQTGGTPEARTLETTTK